MLNNSVINQINIEIISLLLSHYRNITTITKLQRTELEDLMLHCPSYIYAGFANKQIPIVDVKNIVSDYLSLIKATIKRINADIDNARKSNDTYEMNRLRQTRDIIKCRYLNKIELSVPEIEKKLDISRTHFPRHHKRALSVFTEYFIQELHKKNYKGLSKDTDYIELIIYLSKSIKENTKKHCA